MSDCKMGGRVRYTRYVPEGTVTHEEDVMRGKVVFDDGTELPLSYYRHNGRSVERFEMDGERFERAGAAYSPERGFAVKADEVHGLLKEHALKVLEADGDCDFGKLTAEYAERIRETLAGGGRCTNPDDADCGRDCDGCEFYEE